MSRSLIPVALLALTAFSAQGAVVIADPNMFATDYTGLTLANNFGACCATGISLSSGGNPGNHRFLRVALSSPGAAYVSERNVFTYNPATSGAISTISFSIDAYSVPAGSQVGFLVHQNGNNYYHLGHFPVTGTYSTDNLPGTLVNQFNLNFISGINPDFSSSGAPIQFGYFASVLNVSGQNIEASTFFDNFLAPSPCSGRRCFRSVRGANAPPWEAAPGRRNRPVARLGGGSPDGIPGCEAGQERRERHRHDQ